MWKASIIKIEDPPKKTKMDTADHKSKMQELIKIRVVRGLNLEIIRLPVKQLKQTLREKRLNTRGSLEVKQDRMLRANVKEAGLEPEMVPWYKSDLQEERNQDQESSSEEELVAAKKPKKKRGRKRNIIRSERKTP